MARRHEALTEALARGELLAVEASTDPWSHLLSGVAAARLGRFDLARASAERAVSLAGAGGGPVRYGAAHLLYVTRDHGRAIGLLRDLTGGGGSLAGRAYRDAITLAGRLGWAADVRELLEGAMALEPRKLRWFVEAARVHVRARAWEPAQRALESAVALEDGSASLWMELASVAAEANDRSRALHAVERALALDEDPLLHVEAARVASVAGDLERAEAILEAARERDPADGRAVRQLAELRLWRRDDESVLALVDSLEAGEGPEDEEEARDLERLRAAVHLFQGRPAEALALLQRPGGDYRRPLLRAEALWRLGQVEASHAALTEASMTAPGFLPVAWLIRLRSLFGVDICNERLVPERFSEIGELLAGLVEDALATLAEGDPDRVRALLDEALERLGGNRTVTPTRLVDGQLERLPPITGERHAARRALESIRSLPPDQVLAKLEATRERFGGSALAVAHHGELLLWLRRYDEARATLEASIATTPKTRWPYIGLSAIDLVEGAWERCLETNAVGIRAMDDTVGAAVYVHRGEALYRLGRLDEAVADLEEALRIHPSRVTARIVLLLARWARGEADRARQLWEELNEQAVGLLSDAAAAAGVALFTGPEPPPVGRALPVLEEAMRLFGANRSSTLMMYFAADGRQRFVPHWPHSGRKPHDGDASDLDRLDHFLRAILRLPEARAEGPRRDAGRDRGARDGLRGGDGRQGQGGRRGPDELGAELARAGYVTLRGAAPEALLARLRRRALRRLRVRPERFLKSYDERRDRAAAEAFDPSDPDTFWRERLDVLGDGLIDVPGQLPRVWGAMGSLLGGEDRLATRSISENLILNLRPHEDWEGTLPHRGVEGWHVDDPSRTATLRDWTNGLVGLMLVDDVLPGAGGTYVAPESIALVARAMAARPRGLDLTSFELGSRLSRQCSEFVELHGRAGDVFLLHPLMLHSWSPNPSGRVRWLSNPMFYVKDPLRFEGPAGSPVEQVVIDALRR